MVLNCGNGHFEREFIEANIIDSAIGVDISEDLIIKANLIKGDKKIDYILSDINNFDFNTVNFDLLIVYAAGHHIKCLNKVFNGARKKLIENKGMILGLTIYERIEINMIMIFGKKLTFIKKLPEDFQNQIIYPHLPTMLKSDHSEAIHSELLEDTLKKYFNLNFTTFGGGIAYEILSHNNKIRDMINKDINKELVNKVVQTILDWDIKESKKKDNRFNFFLQVFMDIQF